MIRELYRVTIAAAGTSFTSRSTKFSGKRSFLERTTNREMGFGPDARYAISPEKSGADYRRDQPLSHDGSDDLIAEELPSPSVNSISKSMRGNKLDLRAECERKSDELAFNTGCLRHEASTSLRHSDGDSYFPTSFGKKRQSSTSSSSKFHQASKYGKSKDSSSPGKGVNRDEPFDICQSGTTRQDFLEPAFHERNSERQTQMENLIEETGQVFRPGMVLLKNFISLDEQVDIVRRCQKLGLGPGGFYRPGYKDGTKLRLYMMCLGLDWNPQTRAYQEKREHDGAKPPDIPLEFSSLVRRAFDDSHTLIERTSMTTNVEDILPRISPDVCIVNFYTSNGRLGLHQDRDESGRSLLGGLPVVSFSLGDSAEFLYGDERDINKAEKILLELGDVLIFGGESRHIFHGVTAIIPNTSPPSLLEHVKLRPGRLNLTFRKY